MCRMRLVYQKAGGSHILVMNMYILCQSPLFSDPEYKMVTQTQEQPVHFQRHLRLLQGLG